ncbi:MAG: serine hydrolase, partial [Ferruginibacter sp.]
MIKKILLVSDNDAFNRLYEFLGQDYINQSLHHMGYQDAQILHRLQTSLSAKDNRITNPISFLDSAGKQLYSQPMIESKATYLPRKDSMGIGYMAGNKLVKAAMDFSQKNRMALEDLHTILVSLVFPAAMT